MEDKKYIKLEPYVDEEAIHIPAVPYAVEGNVAPYKVLITKDLFVEAYNKWILHSDVEPDKERIKP